MLNGCIKILVIIILTGFILFWLALAAGYYLLATNVN